MKIHKLRLKRLQLAEDDSKKYNMDIRFLWLSSLSPNSRKCHVIRHGQVYTVKNIIDFYSNKENIKDCTCSFSEVINGDVPEKLLTRINKQKEEWIKENS